MSLFKSALDQCSYPGIIKPVKSSMSLTYADQVVGVMADTGVPMSYDDLVRATGLNRSMVRSAIQQLGDKVKSVRVTAGHNKYIKLWVMK